MMVSPDPCLIGRSNAVQNLSHFIRRAAECEENIGLQGESGVGKGLAASLIHRLGPRHRAPFIKVNCANIQEQLLESELFGVRRGAFTGAEMDKPGLIELADGGTFFLDEIGDIGPEVQAKLLSIVEDRSLRRLGDSIVRPVSARFIFATHKNLLDMVKAGKFRADLFFRINVLFFEIPPLRQRLEDLPLLIQNILKRKGSVLGKQAVLTHKAMERLLSHDYPGNVRELESILKRALFISDGCNLDSSSIQIELGTKANVTPDQIPAWDPYSLFESIRKSKGNISQAAERLGISRTHYYRLINRLKSISPQESRSS